MVRLASRIALAYCLFLSYPVSGQPTSGIGSFALGFHAENWKKCSEKGRIRCVLGKIPSGREVQALGLRESTVCGAKAQDSFESEFDSGSFPLTNIRLNDCPNFKFELAVIGEQLGAYKLLSLTSLSEPSGDVLHKVEATVRRVAPKFKPSSPEHLLVLSKARPVIRQLPNQKQGSFIVIFENAKTPGDQVHFLYSSGRVRLIHSASSIASVFSLGGRDYIHYRFTCRIGCGFWGSILVEFSGESFKVELFDASTST